jgi:hypothetical protein
MRGLRGRKGKRRLWEGKRRLWEEPEVKTLEEWKTSLFDDLKGGERELKKKKEQKAKVE